MKDDRHSMQLDEQALAGFVEETRTNDRGRGAGEAAGSAAVERISNDPIVYLGLNPMASRELAVLQKANADQGGAVGITNAEKDGASSTVAGRRTLTTPAGRQAFLVELGLPAPIGRALEGNLASFDDAILDEIVQLIAVLWQVEQGTRTMHRLVLSGHSDGVTLWGDQNGEIGWEQLGQVIGAFPKARASVQHLFVSACNAGWERTVEIYRAMFPQLESVWSYTSASPGAEGAAPQHLGCWEGGTDQCGDKPLQRGVASSLPFGNNVAIWTRSGGYQMNPRYANLQAAASILVDPEFNDVYERAKSGDLVCQSPSAGKIFDWYERVQAVLGNATLPADTRKELSTVRDELLLIRFWPKLLAGVGARYAPELSAFSQALSGAEDAARFLPLRVEGMSRKQYIDMARNVMRFGPHATSQIARKGALVVHSLLDLEMTYVDRSWL
jgi:hypothetical protein